MNLCSFLADLCICTDLTILHTLQLQCMTLQSKQVQPFVLNPSILHETCPHSCCRIFVGFLAKTCATTPGCFLFICQPTEIAGMLRVLERIQALCKSFWARNQIKMKFLQHFLSNCVVLLYAYVCLYAFYIDMPPLEYTTDPQSCKQNFRVQRNGFQKTSSFSPASLLYPPDHWTKIPSGLHVVAVRMGNVG